ncbi:MAG: membrane protein insertion efficiency factor YidD [Candidatus Glassbacteria bacterium]
MVIKSSMSTLKRFTVQFLCMGIKIYRLTISGLLPPSCRFYPSCSRYAEMALRKHGLIRGGGKSLLRILRCAPWSRGGVDIP